MLTYGPIAAPLAQWVVAEPLLALSAGERADLAVALPGGEINVRQQGSYALSEPLCLATLN